MTDFYNNQPYNHRGLKVTDLSERHGYEPGHYYEVTNSETGELINTIKFQSGGIQYVGINGLQGRALLAIAMDSIRKMNDKFCSDENIQAVTHIGTAIDWLDRRTADREKRGVLGKAEK